jgi:hypothetical protein
MTLRTPPPAFQIWCPQVIDLSGSAVTYDFPIAPAALPLAWGNRSSTCVLIIKELLVLYTEGTAAAGTNNILIGSEDDNDYHHTISTLNSKSVGDLTIINQSSFAGESRVFNTENTLRVHCIGGLGAAGEIRVGMTVVADYSQWKNFDQTA